MSKQHVSMPAIRRLPRYYRFLKDLLNNGVTRISSMGLAGRMGLTASQIRQDFNYFGDFGQQGYGYNVEKLTTQFGEILGVNHPRRCILIGAGNLGKALVNQLAFEELGFRLVGVFDIAPDIVGQTINKHVVLNFNDIDTLFDDLRPQMAILCVPRDTAISIAEKMVSLGVTCFWNFSHKDITMIHPDVIVENVHLNDSLLTLSYKLRQGHLPGNE